MVRGQENVDTLCFSLYAIKVGCTAGKRKATLFLRREVIVGSIHYQIKEREVAI